MDENIELTSGHWLLIVGDGKIIPTLLKVTGRLAVAEALASHDANTADRGLKPPRPVLRVIDCGYRYDAFVVGNGAKHNMEALQRIELSQPTTCQEMLSVLKEIPADSTPFVVIDFLRVFWENFLGCKDRKRMLKESINQLDRLAKGSAGLVSVHPPRVLGQMDSELLRMVKEMARDTYHVEMAPHRPESVAARYS
jgi:hypothetical protein